MVNIFKFYLKKLISNLIYATWTLIYCEFNKKNTIILYCLLFKVS